MDGGSEASKLHSRRTAARLESSLARSVDLLSNPVGMQVPCPNPASQRRDFGYRLFWMRLACIVTSTLFAVGRASWPVTVTVLFQGSPSSECTSHRPLSCLASASASRSPLAFARSLYIGSPVVLAASPFCYFGNGVPVSGRWIALFAIHRRSKP